MREIFESIEDFDNWWYHCGIGEIGNKNYRIILERTKEKGYIKQNPLDILEELERAYLNNEKPFEPLVLVNRQRDAIEYLKDRGVK